MKLKKRKREMSLYKLIKFIINHPYNSRNKFGGVTRFLKWQINCRINPYPIVYQFTENSRFIMWKGLTGATGNYYCGLMEYCEMGFLLNFLRPTDLFIDVGANVGAYTILASAEIKARTIAFEPIPATYKNLLNNISINNMQERVRCFNIGLGGEKGLLSFTKSLDTMNHVAQIHDRDVIDIEIDTLDNLLNDERPSLIKIDVEGFETEVIRGSERLLDQRNLKAIIIELNGSGYRYGYDENLIHEHLLQIGFVPYDYNPQTRKLMQIDKFGKMNTIYIRDIEFVRERINESREIRIGSGEHII